LWLLPFALLLIGVIAAARIIRARAALVDQDDQDVDGELDAPPEEEAKHAGGAHEGGASGPHARAAAELHGGTAR
jgi:hypothetical protein